MSEQFADVGRGIELCYETFGAREDPAMLMIMGLGTQMLGWDEGLCEQLTRGGHDAAARGFFVIRFDNRDCGQSTWLRDEPPPSPLELVTRRIRRPAYTLDDMAADAAGLLDHLDISRAHVVGASMGGMIAQVLAGTRPDRVLSLTSVMSTTGGRFVGQPAFRVYPFFLGGQPQGKQAAVDRVAALFKIVGSRRTDAEMHELRDTASRSYDRAHGFSGTLRQLAAITASGDRTSALARIEAPTLVIHGKRDRLISPSGGKASAKAIPGARLLMIDDMGHDLPRSLWPRLVEAIVGNTGYEQADPGKRIESPAAG